MSVHFRTLICAVPGGNMPANFPTLKAMAQIDNAPAVAPTTVLRFMVFPSYRVQRDDDSRPLLLDGRG